MRKEIVVLFLLSIPLLLVHNALAVVPDDAGSASIFNVKDFGAKADGNTLDNDAINKAIMTCNKSGGGIVFFPPGDYLSGSIRLKSNVTLNISRGATIIAAPADANAFDPPETNPYDMYQDFGHSHWHNSLIWAEKQENIGIIGHGTIFGKGLSRNKYIPGGGNKAIALKECKNIIIKDITIRHGGHFAILPTGCDNMRIDGIKIDSNRDGINIDCCKNVIITNCMINTPLDDAIVPKSSYALGYLKATENLTISNCIITGYKEGTMLDGTYQYNEGRNCGKLKFGTESNGGFKNVTITNCVLENSEGLSFLSVDGAVMENITVSNITMNRIHASPIFMRLGSRLRGPEGGNVGKIRNIKLSNICATDVDSTYASIISGIPGHYIENITLHNIRIEYRGGGKDEWAEIIPPENESGYPDSTMFGPMPVYGFYARHVKGLKLDDVHLSFNESDPRSPLEFNDIQGLVLDDVTVQLHKNNPVPLMVRDVADVKISDLVICNTP